MPEKFRDWKTWLRGLVAAVIGAAANAVTVLIVEPAAFDNWRKLAQFCAVSAVLALAMYLKQSPLPPER